MTIILCGGPWSGHVVDLSHRSFFTFDGEEIQARPAGMIEIHMIEIHTAGPGRRYTRSDPLVYQATGELLADRQVYRYRISPTTLFT